MDSRYHASYTVYTIITVHCFVVILCSPLVLNVTYRLHIYMTSY